MPLAALGGTLALDFNQLRLCTLDGLANHAPIQLNLCFTRAAPHTNTTLLALQMAPAAHQARAEVLQARQLNLQLALMATRALGKNLQNQHGTVIDRHLQQALKIALLGRA